MAAQPPVSFAISRGASCCHSGFGTTAFAPSTPTSAGSSASSALLVIEVSDSTLRYDRDEKVPLDSRHRVAELWIVYVQADRPLLYGGLRDGKYNATPCSIVPLASRLRVACAIAGSRSISRHSSYDSPTGGLTIRTTWEYEGTALSSPDSLSRSVRHLTALSTGCRSIAV